MRNRSEKLKELHRRQLCFYEAYLSGEINKETYLLSIYPLDCEIDRLELSYLYGRMNRLHKLKKRI